MMKDGLRRAVEQSIESSSFSDSLRSLPRIADFQNVSGGCINQTGMLKLGCGERLFVKWNESAPKGMLKSESHGLVELERTAAIRIPQVICNGEFQRTQFLVLEYVESSRPAANFFEGFGRQLAKMHCWQNNASSPNLFGFEVDNFIGSTPQPNSWCEDWSEFWTQNRLGYQIKVAFDNGYLDTQLGKLADRAMVKMEEQLDAACEKPSLLHGDLWSGNFMVDQEGGPVLIDPACYFGHREAEFGMITLFGGFDESFFAAYDEALPMAEGFQERIEIYKLYHLLNHLNLFGSGYLSDCISVMKKFC